MKRILTLLLLTVSLSIMAHTVPEDTIIFMGNRKLVVKENEGKIKVKVYEAKSYGDTIKNDQIFEGVYLDGQSTEQRMSVAIPFIKKEKKNKRRWYFDPHVGGIYIGYNRFFDGMSFGSSDEIDLVSKKSWEWGINLFDGSLNLSRNFAFTSGLGFGYTSFRIDNNKGFYREDGKTILKEADIPEGSTFGHSRLRYYHLRLPIALEWQQRFNNKGPVFLSFGPEVEMRLWARSKAKIDGRKKQLANDLNVRPIGINLIARAGYGCWGFYGRYSTASLFEKDKGPEMNPFSFGIQWYW